MDKFADRLSFGYVVSIDGARVTLNLRDEHKGHYVSHIYGVVTVTDIGNLFAVESGHRLLILKVQSLSFIEPREAHSFRGSNIHEDPLRNLNATVVGFLQRQEKKLNFVADSLISPSLGAEAFPLFDYEISIILKTSNSSNRNVNVGEAVRGGGNVNVPVVDFLARHVAVLGSTGQGKSCFTAAILQQLIKLPNSRIVVLDVNGEYEQALKPHIKSSKLKITSLGGSNGNKIPYYALGRHGLARLLIPSEKTQRPALNFAIENLQYVEWGEISQGARLAGASKAVLFDDCRPSGAAEAEAAIKKLREKNNLQKASKWPHMSALAALVAESYSITMNRATAERNGFHYGNVSPLVTRIRRFVEDPQFTSVINIEGGSPNGDFSWQDEGKVLIDNFFGSQNSDWNLHIINLKDLAHDLMPFILGSLLELFAFELFRRGQGNNYPTLLVLEEAHHYLRSIIEAEDAGKDSLAYERLAKEGRKFGISLWVSTQRPSELSATVLSQCGTWVVFKLSSDQDLKYVSSAAEWVDKQELSRIAGLPRRQAIIFGAGVSLPTRIIAPEASPLPKSDDGNFDKWLNE
jgi:uncharacterized protein